MRGVTAESPWVVFLASRSSQETSENPLAFLGRGLCPLSVNGFLSFSTDGLRDSFPIRSTDGVEAEGFKANLRILCHAWRKIETFG